MNADLEKTLKSLKKNEFDASYAENTESACKIILGLIPEKAVVGIGDSVTVRQIGVLDALEKRGQIVINPWAKEKPGEKSDLFAVAMKTRNSDVYLTGSNALTMDGKIVNTDMTGNRVASMIYGIPTVILAIGRNKIVKDLDAALDRIKTVIAPQHNKTKGRPNPCAKTGKCSDCTSPYRLCRVTTIMEKRPFRTDVKVVLVDADLGLSWDPAWDKERIQRIIANYEPLTVARPLAKPIR
ncbi:MAG: lactate utilization protein [Dehalococcoidales bacterium]|nr:lactate utilization protein [Dehalococcoidales bacterium]